MSLNIVIPPETGDEQFEWDSSENSGWTPSFQKVEIAATADGTMQPAYFRRTCSAQPRPLIVSLHTWSGGYDQKDPITADVEGADLNYIHPHFRGFNRTPQALVSPTALADIDDAIAWAIANGNVDPERIHIVGVSGGALAALAYYMDIDRPVASVDAWVPISDIYAWYWESLGRRFNYAAHIMAAIGRDGLIDRREALRRSPLYKRYPAALRRDTPLRLYAGIHDGHIGCVPVSHSINFYNRIVGERKYGTADLGEIYCHAETDADLVSKDTLLSLLEKRLDPDSLDCAGSLLGRHVHMFRQSGSVALTIFEGEHEQLPGALSLIVP